MGEIGGCVNGVERRGNVYHLRWRVPEDARAVEARAEVTRTQRHAIPRTLDSVLAKRKWELRAEWQAPLPQRHRRPDLDTFRACVKLLL
jgi:hypothetical protein